MIDGVLATSQTRDDLLDALERRYFAVNNNPTTEGIASFQRHIRNDDFPESIETYSQIASTQNWRNFEVVLDKEIFACLVFTK